MRHDEHQQENQQMIQQTERVRRDLNRQRNKGEAGANKQGNERKEVKVNTKDRTDL